MRFPLTDVRVLDLSRLLPGAFATLMLAELGADVIKIEDPRTGDPMRSLPPLVNGRGIYDLLLNRGKKSVALDLRAPESAAVLDRLLARSDVVVESFRPGTARRLGVSGEQIRERHPGRPTYGRILKVRPPPAPRYNVCLGCHRESPLSTHGARLDCRPRGARP